MIDIEPVAAEMRPVACLVAARMFLYVLVAHRCARVSLELSRIAWIRMLKGTRVE